MKVSPILSTPDRTRGTPDVAAYNPDKPEFELHQLEPLDELRNDITPEGAAAGGPDPERVAEAARQFESWFLSHLLKTMRQTVPEGGLFQNGFASDTYTELLDEEYAREISDYGGIGIAAMLERQLLGEE